MKKKTVALRLAEAYHEFLCKHPDGVKFEVIFEHFENNHPEFVSKTVAPKKRRNNLQQKINHAARLYDCPPVIKETQGWHRIFQPGKAPNPNAQPERVRQTPPRIGQLLGHLMRLNADDYELRIGYDKSIYIVDVHTNAHVPFAVDAKAKTYTVARVGEGSNGKPKLSFE